MGADILSDFVDDQVRSILREQMIAEAPPFAAIVDIGEIARFPTMLRAKHPVNLDALGDGSFVQVCPTLGYKSLWTEVSNKRDYRAAYATFLSLHYPAIAAALNDQYHVDHLFNRTRAEAIGLKYVRMALVKGSANTSHGGGYERGRTAAGLGKGRAMVSVDLVMLMKLYNLPSPPRSGEVTPAMRSFAAHVAPMLDTTVADILRSLVHLAKDVAGFRGG